MRTKSLYSYHSFILPFMFMADKKTIYQIFDNPTDDNIWIRLDTDVAYNSDRVISFEKIEDNKDYYDAYKFFNEAGRSLVFSDMQTDIVRNYEVRPDVVSGLFYVIGTREKEYKLPIVGIHLKIYNTDTAVIMIQCTNTEYCSIEDAKKINEYGRRLALPYWPSQGETCEKCATYLKIADEKEQRIVAVDDFLENFDKRKRDVSLAYISTVIRMLLNRNGCGYRFRGKSVLDEHQIQIKSLLNEKMFVAAYICDAYFCAHLAEDYKKNGMDFSSDAKRSLLELIRVDLPGNCSILNEGELTDYLKEHLYMTEFGPESGKLTAVTDQAYIKLASIPDFEKGYYRAAYVPLLMIPIVQRNSIARFQQRIMELSSSVQKRIDAGSINRIMDIQQQYVGFQNHFLQQSLTEQKEGNYVYRKLQEQLRVYEENSVLETQVGKLFELANIKQGDALNKLAMIMSLLALVSSAFAYLLTAQDLSAIKPSEFRGGGVIVLTLISEAVVVLITLLVIFKKQRRR